MFKNLTDIPSNELDDRIAELARNLEVTHCPQLTNAFNELINKQRHQPFKVQQIYAILSRRYSAIFLNNGFLISVSFDREKEKNRHNTVYRNINDHRYEFRFDIIPRGPISIVFNKFILDKDRLNNLKTVVNTAKLIDALVQVLNGMTHDDLHSYLAATPSPFLDPDQKIYMSQIFKMTYILFGGDAEPDDPRTGNLEAFIMGLHAARLKFTKAGKPIYKRHIEALFELFSVCAASWDEILHGGLSPNEYYETLYGLQYIETIGMRAAWHLIQPGELTYEKLENHFTQLRTQHLEQVGKKANFSSETAEKFIRSFADIFEDVHTAMETNLNQQSPGLIQFGGEVFTPIQLFQRMHYDKAFASNMAAHFFTAYETDSKAFEVISKRQKSIISLARL